MADLCPQRIRRRPDRQPDPRPLSHPQRALPPEAPRRLAQQIATILQRLRAEGPGRDGVVCRGH
jgi:hypothetical protein